MTIQVAAAASQAESVYRRSKTGSAEKPVWNPKKVYQYLEDMNAGFQAYKKQAVSYYAQKISERDKAGVLTTEELKKEIQEWFPEYTLTDTEPQSVRQGTFYLYIDKRQMEKMASDPAYRAKVYGLMDSELQGKYGYTLQYSDGRNVTAHLTGSIFSLSENNRAYDSMDGIPYRGSCTSDHSYSSTSSHVQVRSMSFLYDHMDTGGMRKNHRSNPVKSEAQRLKERQEKKRAEKRKKQKAEELKAFYEEMRSDNVGAKYQKAEDLDADAEDSEHVSGKVSFNAEKRARQLAAAKTPAQVKAVMALLEKDLSDCEAGVENSMCDEDEVAKVRDMMKEAQKKLGEVSAKAMAGETDPEADLFSLNLLM